MKNRKIQGNMRKKTCCCVLYACHAFLPIAFSQSSSEEATPRGLVGPGQYASEAHGPPLNPESWHVTENYVLNLDQVWGLRIMPQAVFQVPGGVGLLYNSRPPHGFRAPKGFAHQQTGSLAFSRNLVEWHDYPGNPVLHEVQDWQGASRAMPNAMLYDPKREQWVVYLGISEGDYSGIRAISAAYSMDLVNWTYDKGPSLTIDDFAKAVPALMKATAKELRAEGRVYANWALYHEGRYYLGVQGSVVTGRNRRYENIVLAADKPAGPFEHAKVESDFTPTRSPVYSNGKWYCAFPGHWDGKPGFGLAWSENLLGPYEKSPKNPIIAVETISRSRPILFRYDGTWAILFARFYDYRDMRLRMALANIHPSLLEP